MPYGPYLYPATTTYPGAAVYPGQGDVLLTRPEAQVLVSFDDYDQTPAWQDVTARTFNFRSSRGREDELQEISAGTGSVLFDNRDLYFKAGGGSPVYPSASTYPSTSVFPGGGITGPMNRIWIREYFNGKIRTLFQGYADNYNFTWEALAERAQMNVVDEFTVLVQKGLLRNDPDVDTYADIVAFDEAVGYWKMDDDPALMSFQGTGGTLFADFSVTASTDGPILGDKGGKFQYKSAVVPSGQQIISDPLGATDPGSVDNLDEFTIELWVKNTSGLPGTERMLVRGPGDGAVEQYAVSYLTTGQINFFARNSALSDIDVTGGLILKDTRWHHLVCTIEGGKLKIYIDAVNVGETNWTSPFGTHAADEFWQVPEGGSGAADLLLSNVAFYRKGLTSDRVQAHYDAASHGFIVQDTNARISQILDTIGSTVPRAIWQGEYEIVPTFQHGQDALSEIRQAVLAEQGDALFFHGADVIAVDSAPNPRGFKLVFLAGNHRDYPPYTNVKATFADSGFTAAPEPSYTYLELTRDYSQAFLINEWAITDGYGFLSLWDAGTSERYGPHPRSLTIPTPEVDPGAMQKLLTKYGLPMERITSILLDTSEAATAEALFELELGDQVRVVYGPSNLDQRSFIQKIDWNGANDARPWTCRLSLSPL